jgi:hypothetical protein
MEPDHPGLENAMRRLMLPTLVFLAVVLCAGAAFAAAPEAQGPMSVAVQPAAPGDPAGIQPSPLKLQPEKVFRAATCTFQYSDCFSCGIRKIQACDVYSCYDPATGQTTTQKSCATPCGNIC